jgi:hypothetical protein
VAEQNTLSPETKFEWLLRLPGGANLPQKIFRLLFFAKDNPRLRQVVRR